MPTTTPIKSIRDQVLNRLRGELLSGQHPPGTPLREEALAERLGVSRMPIRNAFQELVHEGILVSRRNCGVSVAPPPGEVVNHLLNPLRAQIETYAVRHALPALAAEQFGDLEAVLEEMAEACRRKDDAAVIDSDFLFHQTFLTAAGLEEIVPVWKGVVSRLRDFHIGRNQTQPDYGVIPYVHARLVEVFRAGDVEAAVLALASHIENGEFNQQAIQAFHASR